MLGGGRGRGNNGGLPGMLISGVSTSVGFVKEVRAYKKARKEALKEQEERGNQEGASRQASPSPLAPPSQSPRPSPDYQRQDMDLRDLHNALPEDSLPPPYTEEGDRSFNDEKRTRNPEERPGDDRNRSLVDHGRELERTWQLDEAQDAVVNETKPHKNKQGTANPDKVIAAFLQRVPPPNPNGPVGRLALPVAIPQRRPKDKSRGFIRAYAPDLENVGIDQTSWLDFIETLNEASLANPWIQAINLVGLAASPLPTITSQAISIALMVATNAAMEVQTRYRQNHALDRLNKEYFQPRGLYCLVLTWDPTKFNAKTNSDINATIQNNIGGQGSMSHRFQSSNGVTNGVTNGLETMETAELVFPELDLIAKSTTGDQKGFKKKWSRGMAFVDDYMDRRAQAKFYAANPDGPLNQRGKPQFSSKYADPTYNANPLAKLNGGLRGGLGGGGLGGRGSGGGLLGGGLGGGLGGRATGGGLLGLGGRGSGGGLLGGGLGGGLVGRGQPVQQYDAYGNPIMDPRYMQQQGVYTNRPMNNSMQYQNNMQYENEMYGNNMRSGNSPQPHQQYGGGHDQRGSNQPQPHQQHGGGSNSGYSGQRGFNQQQQMYQQGMYQQGMHQGMYQQGMYQQPSPQEMQQIEQETYQQQQTQQYFQRGVSLTNLFGSKVLYLMVVNMPTDEEMAMAQQITDSWDIQGNSEQYTTTYRY